MQDNRLGKVKSYAREKNAKSWGWVQAAGRGRGPGPTGAPWRSEAGTGNAAGKVTVPGAGCGPVTAVSLASGAPGTGLTRALGFHSHRYTFRPEDLCFKIQMFFLQTNIDF